MSQILSILGELRGRLDEIEHIVRYGDQWKVPFPTSFEDDDIETITPQVWEDFQAEGLSSTITKEPYEALAGLIQFGAANDQGVVCNMASFELSDLHHGGTEKRYGLRLDPIGKKQSWFTYEILLDNPELKQFEWMEWVIKVSSSEPVDVFFQFIFDGLDEDIRIDKDSKRINEFSSFIHLQLSRETVMKANAQDATRLRLIWGTDGLLIPFNIYALAVYAKKIEL